MKNGTFLKSKLRSQPITLKGETLLEKYRIKNFIAEGSIATVWSAENIEANNSKVAVKHISFADASVELLKRTCREIKLLKFLSDYDQIITLYDVVGYMDSDNNNIVEVFLVLEYMQEDLSYYIKHSPVLSLDTVKKITAQILTGLYIIHKQDIIHRDIKPQNILLTMKPEIQAKLGDFGTGRFVTSASKFNVSALLEVSTIYYCAPEGLLNPNSYGTSVDIWALGCIVYEMITQKALLTIQNFEIKNFEMGLLKKMISICGKPKPNELENLPDSELKTFVLNFPETDSPPLLEQFLNTIDDQQLTSMINGLLSFGTKKRLTSESSFQEPFISQPLPIHLLSKKKDEIFKEPLDTPEELWTDYLLEEINIFI
jgi:serine/threonine protein kinase